MSDKKKKNKELKAWLKVRQDSAEKQFSNASTLHGRAREQEHQIWLEQQKWHVSGGEF